MTERIEDRGHKWKDSVEDDEGQKRKKGGKKG